MKVVLVQPKTPLNSSWEALPLGYLKAYAEQFLDKAKYQFFSGYFDSDKEIIEGCEGADYVGFSCTTPQIPHAAKLIKELRNGSPVQTIIGGVHASAQPEHTARFCDLVVQGEGEVGFLHILKGRGDSPSEYNHGRIIKMPYVMDLDALPFPDRHFIKQERNIAVTERNDKERIAAIFSSRGCSYRCVFCSSHEVWERVVRYHSPQRVVKEMENLVDEWKIDFIKFSDDTFTVNEDRVARICELITNNGLIGNVEWGCNIRANTSDHLLKKMKDAGCREVWIGAETGSPKILKDMRKGITIDQTKHIFEVTKRLGLFRRVYFMIGMPNESEQDIELTRELAKQIEADQYGFSIYCAMPNNSIFKPEMLDTMHLDKLDEYTNPYTSTNFLTNADLISWQKKLIEEFKGRMCFRQRDSDDKVVMLA